MAAGDDRNNRGKPQPQSDAGKQNYRNSAEKSTSPVAVNGMTESNGHTHNSDENKPHRDIARWTRAVAVFTFFLVLASGASDWFIYQQYAVANQAQRDSREQLRAVLNEDGGNVGFVRDTTPEHPVIAVTATALLHNYGGTRTGSFTAWISMHYFAGPSPPNDLDTERPWDKLNATNAIIGANAAVAIGPAGIQGDDLTSFLQRKGIALVWGHARYTDIFSDTKVHNIGFCLIVTEPASLAAISADPATAPGLPNPTLHFYQASCNYSD